MFGPRRLMLGVAITAIASVACAQSTGLPAPTATTPRQLISGMTGMGDTGSFAPLVSGFYEGGEIRFIHTEASDPKVAGMLTSMMGPAVAVVPDLAQVPDSATAPVYVFTNGVKGGGPFEFQPDVFDSVPGDAGYSPLRTVNIVTWKDGQTARLLRSEIDVRDAESKGELTVVRPGVVVNMPVLNWPGGSR